MDAQKFAAAPKANLNFHDIIAHMATPQKAFDFSSSDSLPEVQNTKPPLKWAGGKRWQLPHLLPYWKPESHRRLVEPFCGGLAVVLGLVPEKALLNDINTHLINF